MRTRESTATRSTLPPATTGPPSPRPEAASDVAPAVSRAEAPGVPALPIPELPTVESSVKLVRETLKLPTIKSSTNLRVTR